MLIIMTIISLFVKQYRVFLGILAVMYTTDRVLGADSVRYWMLKDGSGACVARVQKMFTVSVACACMCACVRVGVGSCVVVCVG